MKLQDFSFRNRKQEKLCLVNNIKCYKISNYALSRSNINIHFYPLCPRSTFHPSNKTASIHALSLYQTRASTRVQSNYIDRRNNPTYTNFHYHTSILEYSTLDCSNTLSTQSSRCCVQSSNKMGEGETFPQSWIAVSRDLKPSAGLSASSPQIEHLFAQLLCRVCE